MGDLWTFLIGFIIILVVFFVFIKYKEDKK